MQQHPKKVKLTLILLLGFTAASIIGYSYYSYKVREWEALEDLRSDNPMTRIDAAEYLVSIQSFAAAEYWKNLISSSAKSIDLGEGATAHYDDWAIYFLSKIDPKGKEAIFDLIHSQDRVVVTWTLKEIRLLELEGEFALPQLIKLYNESKPLINKHGSDVLLDTILAVGKNSTKAFDFLLSKLSLKVTDEERNIIFRSLAEFSHLTISRSLKNIAKVLGSCTEETKNELLSLIEDSSDAEADIDLNIHILIPYFFEYLSSKDAALNRTAFRFLVIRSAPHIKNFDQKYADTYSQLTGEDKEEFSCLIEWAGPKFKAAILNNLFGSIDPEEILHSRKFFKYKGMPSFLNSDEVDIGESITLGDRPLWVIILPHLIKNSTTKTHEKALKLLFENNSEDIDFFTKLSLSDNPKLRSFGNKGIKFYNNLFPDEKFKTQDELNLEYQKEVVSLENHYKLNSELKNSYTRIIENYLGNYPNANKLKLLNSLSLIQSPNFNPTIKKRAKWIADIRYTIQRPTEANVFFNRLIFPPTTKEFSALINELLKHHHEDVHVIAFSIILKNRAYDSKIMQRLTSYFNQNISGNKFRVGFALWWASQGDKKYEKYFYEVLQYRTFNMPFEPYKFWIPDFSIPDSNEDKFKMARLLFAQLEKLDKDFGDRFTSIPWSELLVKFGPDVEPLVRLKLRAERSGALMHRISLRYLQYHNLLDLKDRSRFINLIQDKSCSVGLFIEVIKWRRDLQISSQKLKQLILDYLQNSKNTFDKGRLIQVSLEAGLGLDFIIPFLERNLTSENLDYRELAVYNLSGSSEHSTRVVKSIYEFLRVNLPTLSTFNFQSETFLDSLVANKKNAKHCADLIWNRLSEFDQIPMKNSYLYLLKTLFELNYHHKETVTAYKNLLSSDDLEDAYLLLDSMIEIKSPPVELLPELTMALNKPRFKYCTTQILFLFKKMLPQSKSAISALEKRLATCDDSYNVEEIFETLQLLKRP